MSLQVFHHTCYQDSQDALCIPKTMIWKNKWKERPPPPLSGGHQTRALTTSEPRQCAKDSVNEMAPLAKPFLVIWLPKGNISAMATVSQKFSEITISRSLQKNKNFQNSFVQLSKLHDSIELKFMETLSQIWLLDKVEKSEYNPKKGRKSRIQ